MSEKRTKNIVLTGFMGTGKSTIGRLLAAALGYAVVDTNQLIAQRAGKPIHLIFSEDGEDIFRDWEAQVTKELAREKRLVVATGSEIMLNDRNADALEKSSYVFCLTAKPRDILRRIKKNGEVQPLLVNDYSTDRIEQLLAERAAVYNRYPQINTSGRSPKRVLKELLKAIPTEEDKEPAV